MGYFNEACELCEKLAREIFDEEFDNLTTPEKEIVKDRMREEIFNKE
jgi:ferredoxin